MRCPMCSYTRFGGEIAAICILGTTKRFVDIKTNFTCQSTNFRHERGFPINTFLLYEEKEALKWESKAYTLDPGDRIFYEVYHIIGAEGSWIFNVYKEVLSILQATAIGELVQALASGNGFIQKLATLKFDELKGDT